MCTFSGSKTTNFFFIFVTRVLNCCRKIMRKGQEEENKEEGDREEAGEYTKYGQFYTVEKIQYQEMEQNNELV
jgi:hypothetical protein